jgi:hypothetical protein
MVPEQSKVFAESPLLKNAKIELRFSFLWVGGSCAQASTPCLSVDDVRSSVQLVPTARRDYRLYDSDRGCQLRATQHPVVFQADD